MDPMTNQGAPAPMNDEIDLFELFESLWKERVLIVAITFLSDCLTKQSSPTESSPAVDSLRNL